MTKNSTYKSGLCEISFVNKRNVDAVRKIMKTEKVMEKLAETFKVLGDRTRTKIIFALSKKELCVCDLATLLNISQSAISHQLRVLRNMEIVNYRKDGKIAYYSLNDENIKNLLEQGLEHVEKA